MLGLADSDLPPDTFPTENNPSRVARSNLPHEFVGRHNLFHNFHFQNWNLTCRNMSTSCDAQLLFEHTDRDKPSQPPHITKSSRRLTGGR